MAHDCASTLVGYAVVEVHVPNVSAFAGRDEKSNDEANNMRSAITTDVITSRCCFSFMVISWNADESAWFMLFKDSDVLKSKNQRSGILIR